MDKHERPWQCPLQPCASREGLTYGGGLLRHLREVHKLDGGPKNVMFCPHPSCVRHTKPFARQENFNEHLKRCHGESAPRNVEEQNPLNSPKSVSSTLIGKKRKADDDLRDEVKRLQGENQDLRGRVDTQNHQIEAQNRQSIAMMQQMARLEEQLRAYSNQHHAADSNLGSNFSHNGSPEA